MGAQDLSYLRISTRRGPPVKKEDSISSDLGLSLTTSSTAQDKKADNFGRLSGGASNKRDYARRLNHRKPVCGAPTGLHGQTGDKGGKTPPTTAV